MALALLVPIDCLKMSIMGWESRMKSLGDAKSVAPGADDNASGVAALLEMARILFAVDTTYSIRFCAF